MRKIKCRLIGKGTEEEPYRINLPTYQVSLNEEGIPEIDYKKREANVLVPDDEVDPDTLKLKEKYIREKYGGRWKKFKADEVQL